MEENKNNDYILHKINLGYNYTVYRKEYSGKTSYIIQISQKNMDGTIADKAYVKVMFPKGTDLPDGTKIKIKKAVENFYLKDGNKFNPVFTYYIKEFDLIGDPVQEYNQSEEVDFW